MIICDVEQGTQEWKEARLGIPTASNFDKIVTSIGEPSKQRTKYLYQLAAERITDHSESAYQSADMTRGVEMEAEARALYEILKETEVHTVGVCYKDENRLIGASPDGLIEEDGLLEIKCPISSTHVGYLLAGVLPSEYFQQVQGQLYVTGRAWTDFISYYPGLKPFIIRIGRDEVFIAKLHKELVFFLAELDDVTERIR